jgi:hypothetical protein
MPSTSDNEYYGKQVIITGPVIHIDDTEEDIEFNKRFSKLYKTLSEAFKEDSGVKDA